MAVSFFIHHVMEACHSHFLSAVGKRSNESILRKNSLFGLITLEGHSQFWQERPDFKEELEANWSHGVHIQDVESNSVQFPPFAQFKIPGREWWHPQWSSLPTSIESKTNPQHACPGSVSW